MSGSHRLQRPPARAIPDEIAMAWAVSELRIRREDEPWIALHDPEGARGKIGRGRSIRRRRAGLSKAVANRWLEIAARECGVPA